MKSYFLVFLFVSALCGCSQAPNEETGASLAENSIKEYLHTSLGTNSSYQPLETSEIKPYLVKDSLIQEKLLWEDSIDARLRRHEKQVHSVNQAGVETTIKLLKEAETKRDAFEARINEPVAAADTLQLGYQVVHKFRTKSKRRSAEVKEAVFVLDKNYRVRQMYTIKPKSPQKA